MVPAVRIEGLSKRYIVSAGQRRHSYRTLRESLSGAARAAFRRRAPSTANEFWALKDVGFDVAPGEVLGVIGRNGAGKSTLLKVLSRITNPTRGRVDINGRVGSLLEVGSGFHPELTGRENIFLNGSILGMSRREITKKFDEIVAFAEVEQFLDTPVKRYSSGMTVRLAFAVAANLDPEILIVDEVLAVGDIGFQKKCLGKMLDVSRSGRTILFVSQNMAALQNLCTRGVVLARGAVQFVGGIEEATKEYLAALDPSAGGDCDLRTHPARVAGATPIFRRVKLINAEGRATGTFHSGESMLVDLEVDSPVPLSPPYLAVGVNDHFGQRLFTAASFLSPESLPALHGAARLQCRIGELPLCAGTYSLTFGAGNSTDRTIDWLHNAVEFTVVEADFFESGQVMTARSGPFLMRSQWNALPS